MSVEHYDSPNCDCVPRWEHDELHAEGVEMACRIGTMQAEIERLKRYEADFKKVVLQHCGPKCACVREQREALAVTVTDLAQADADVEVLQGVMKKHDAEIERLRAEVEFLREQNAQLHEQLNSIRAKVHDGSLSAKQIVTSLRRLLDRPK